MLYLHIPFCDSKCFYCSFNSYTDRFHLIRDYMEALRRQTARELERFAPEKGSLRSMFIGGGTPSCVPAPLYAPLFELVAPYLAPDAEITTEANPNSATRDWLEGMRSLGVNRVSFGVQSFDDAKLAFLGRAHRGSEALTAIQAAAATGFEHLSIDLIYGTSADTPGLIERDLRQAFSLPIDHLSCYALTIERGTKFFAMPQAAADDDMTGKMIAEYAAVHGFAHYEISNFGRHPCCHNIGYWELRNYIGAGSGAVGFLNDRRFYPTRDPEKYIADPLAHTVEELTPHDLKTEKVLLGLRSLVGIDPAILSASERARAGILLDENKAVIAAGRIQNRDFFLADEIALFLLD